MMLAAIENPLAGAVIRNSCTHNASSRFITSRLILLSYCAVDVPACHA
jgi:hypothetical protein